MANVENAMADLYGSGKSGKSDKEDSGKDRRMTAVSRKWSASGLGLSASEKEARRLEKKGTFAATMDDEAGTVTLSKDDFKKVMGKLGGHKETAKRSSQNLILLAFGYLAVSIGFIAVIVGLMNWRIEASKESHVKSSTMIGKDGSPVKTATSLTPASIDSRMSDAAWKEIRYLEISSPTGAYASLFIEAYVRVPDKNAVYGSYVDFKTSSGTIRLEGKTLTFEDDISAVLVNAGFSVSSGVSSTQRRLSVSHSLMGLFNSLSAEDIKDWPGMDPLPKIPTTYHATYQIGYSCISKDEDRCLNYEFGTGLPNNRVKKFWESYVPSRQVRNDFSRFVLTDAETWVDADNDMSRTTYTNILPFPGWALHQTSLGNVTHVAQELVSTKEAIFCHTEKSAPAPLRNKVDYSNDWEGAYKGEVNVETPTGIVSAKHFTLMPKETPGMRLDMYLKQTSPTTAEPLIISVQQGESLDDRAYEQIVFRYTSFDTTITNADLKWYISSGDTTATGAFNQVPYCLPDYGSIPEEAQIFTEHPFPGAGPHNWNSQAVALFDQFVSTGDYAVDTSTTLQLAQYSNWNKAVMPPKKSYQGDRLRGYIQYMVTDLSQKPTIGGTNMTILGIDRDAARRRLRRLADYHGDDAWKRDEHISPYVAQYLKNQEYSKEHSSVKVVPLSKADHDKHKIEAQEGTKAHHDALQKTAKKKAVQKKIEKLRNELLKVRDERIRRLAKKEVEDDITAQVINEGVAELAEMETEVETRPDGRPQDWEDHEYLDIYIKEKDAFLHRRLSSVREGSESPIHLDRETYLASQIGILDKAKLCTMNLAAGDFCETVQAIHGARQLVGDAAVSTWPRNNDNGFADSRCNSQFFFNFPLPAGTYNTKNGCNAACDDRYPEYNDECRFTASNLKGPFKSWKCVKRFGCRAICDPESTIMQLHDDIISVATVAVNAWVAKFESMVPTIAELNEQYCCYNFGMKDAWKFIDEKADMLRIPSSSRPIIRQAANAANSQLQSYYNQVQGQIASKLRPYKCQSSTGETFANWKINVCAIEIGDGVSINHYATQLRNKLLEMAREFADKLLKFINSAVGRVAGWTTKFMKSFVGDGYIKNYWEWPSPGTSGCGSKLHHQLCKGSITCQGPLVALGYGFFGQVGGGIHYDFNWLNILNDIEVEGYIYGRLTWGLTIAGVNIQAFNLLLTFRVNLQSNGNTCNPANGKYRLMASATLTVDLSVGHVRKWSVSLPRNCGWRGCDWRRSTVGVGLQVWSHVTLGAMYVPKSDGTSAIQPPCTYDKKLIITARGHVDAEACILGCWARWRVLTGNPIIQPWDVMGSGGPRLGSFSVNYGR